MRWSIKQIFKNLSTTLLILSIILGLLAAVTLTLNSSVEKTNLLVEQKALLNEAYSLGRDDIQLSNIQLRGIVDNLRYDISKMKQDFAFDVLGNYLLGHASQYLKDLEELSSKQQLYIQAAEAYYDQSLEKLSTRLKDLDYAQGEYENKIYQIEEKHMLYEAEKFNILQYIIYLAFGISLMTTLWFTRRLSFIYKDLKTLYSVDLESKERVYLTEEAEMIIKRMNRKPTATENPAFIDPVTEVNNYKGLLHAFANRKGNAGAALVVCVFSLDGLRDIEKKYKKDFANHILKKVAFMFSLYEQHTDVFGRIDYDQFVFVLNRATKDIALHDCEMIRKSIEEGKFKTHNGIPIKVTASGGFVVKQPNKNLDQTIAHAKEVLHAAISQGGNRIAQLRDSGDKKYRV